LAMRPQRARSGNNNNQDQQHLTWYQAFYKAYMDRGRRLEDRNMRNNNRLERRITKRMPIVRKINESFPILFQRMKLFSSTRTSSPEVTTDTNECSESGGIWAAALP
jgi:hypothetical protein